MTLIGCRCTRCEPFSRAVLITRTLLFKTICFTYFFQYVQYNSAKVLDKIKAVIAQGLHLLPFRTEKLNLATPMVLPTRESRKRPPYGRLESSDSSLFFNRVLITFFMKTSNSFKCLLMGFASILSVFTFFSVTSCSDDDNNNEEKVVESVVGLWKTEYTGESADGVYSIVDYLGV